MVKFFSKTVQGYRPYQEDEYINESINNKIYISCIFDGHGGGDVSKFCKENIVEILKHELHNGMQYDIPVMLRKCFDVIDSLIDNLNIPMVGSTAIVCLIYEDTVYFANAGDSLAYICITKEESTFLKDVSIEHKADNPYETKRILESGGVILYDTGMGRVAGNLNLARSLGDFYLKKWVISNPFVHKENSKNIDYIFLASDGIWDVMKKEEVQSILETTGYDFDKALDKIIYTAMNIRSSMDNITATFIKLH